MLNGGILLEKLLLEYPIFERYRFNIEKKTLQTIRNIFYSILKYMVKLQKKNLFDSSVFILLVSLLHNSLLKIASYMVNYL